MRHRSTSPHSPRGRSRTGGSAARAAAGFTLLEAIVALVVFTMGAFALYGWLSTNVITLDRIRERQQVEAAMHSALDMIRRANPMETPGGRRELNGLEVVWTSTLVEPVTPNVDQSTSPAYSTALRPRPMSMNAASMLGSTFCTRPRYTLPISEAELARST